VSDVAHQKITSNLTFETSPGLLEQSKAWFNTPSQKIEIDLASAGRADSAGIALMLQWIENAGANNLQLRFINLPSQVREFIDVNGLDKLFREYTD